MMMASAARPARGGDVLADWAQSLTSPSAGRSRGRLRFAFCGRVSTEDWQDPVTSRARQLQQAVMLVAGHGVIVAEFFDTAESGPGENPACPETPDYGDLTCPKPMAAAG
jgi:hypothetical protein